MRPSVTLSAVLLLLPLIASDAAQMSAPDGSARAYGYNFSFGDDENTGAYLGVDITDVTPERLTALKLKDERGAEITIVDQDAPAGKAGLKEHDVILNLNGTAIDSAAQLRRMIRETPPGRVVSLGVSRDGQPLSVKVQLGDKRKTMAHSKDFKIEVPPIPPMPPMPDVEMPVSVVVVHSSMRSGLAVENITPQLGDFFGVKSGKGVLVRMVAKGSRAEKAGFRAGDVIVKVNDQAVQDTSDFAHALRSRNGNAAFVVIRDKKEQNLSMPLPDMKDSGDLFEESFDEPDVDVDAHLDLALVQNQIAQLRPEMELAIANAQHELDSEKADIEEAQRVANEASSQVAAEAHEQALAEIERQRADIENDKADLQCAQQQRQRELRDQQRQMKEAVRESQRAAHRSQQDIHKKLEEQRKQMDRLRHESQGDWLEI
jgi:hypothetical protein